MVVSGTNILVEQSSDFDKTINGVIFESNKSYTKNFGVVKSLGIKCPTNIDINVGDIVHFSNEAGVYLDKNNMKLILLLDYREIIFVSDNENNEIYVGEDLRYYLEEDIANNMLERTANH